MPFVVAVEFLNFYLFFLHPLLLSTAFHPPKNLNEIPKRKEKKRYDLDRSKAGLFGLLEDLDLVRLSSSPFVSESFLHVTCWNAGRAPHLNKMSVRGPTDGPQRRRRTGGTREALGKMGIRTL